MNFQSLVWSATYLVYEKTYEMKKKIFRKIHGTRKIFVALPGILILIQNEKVGSW